MNLSKVLKIMVVGVAVLAGAVTLPWAFCNSSVETYALFHCANRAYFEPIPGGFTKADITGVFWQLGFGNFAIPPIGQGTDGTGFASKQFNGNDSGSFPVDLLDAAATFPTTGFPAGSVCLGSNNWANSGVDGCCDNSRLSAPFGPYDNAYDGVAYYYTYPNDDNILNPYFGLGWNQAGYPGYYSIASMTDYPTAVLLRLPGDAYFALAAVSNMDRGNTGGGESGPCRSNAPGTNNGVCDVRQGFYAFADVTNGNPNLVPGETGKNNAIPWQTARPRPLGLDCSVTDCGGPTLDVTFQIDPIMVHSDQRMIPSNNPSMATRNASLPRDATRAAGVGSRDVLKKWGQLVRYTLESAPIVPGVNTDPSTGDMLYNTLVWTAETSTPQPVVDPNTGEPTGPVVIPKTVPLPSCWRTRLSIGKTPEAAASLVNCRLAKCGDLGVTIAPLDPGGVTCFGNRDPLVSENIINGAVDTVKGRHTIRWDTTAELTVQGFDIFAVTQRGPRLVRSVDCTECSSGAGASYETVVRTGDVRGGKIQGFQVKMKGGSGAVAELPAR
jgi:hypothetical protein